MAFNVTGLAAWTKANEQQLLTKALFSAKSISLATKQPGIKSAEQINVMETDAVFQADSCGFNASGTTTFSNRTLTVGKIKVQEALCVKTLEAKYLQLTLPQGSSYDKIPFEEKYTSLKTGLIAEKLETAFWQGDTTLTGNEALVHFDGLIKIIDAASGVIESNVADYTTGAPFAASGGITTANVIPILQGVWRAIPPAVLSKEDTVVLVGDDVFRTFQIALTNANLFHYNTNASNGNLEIVIPGSTLKVIAVNGLNGTNRIFALRKSNMFFGTDMLNEEEKFDMFYAQEAMEIRYTAAFKAGVNVAFPNEIVTFTLA